MVAELSNRPNWILSLAETRFSVSHIYNNVLALNIIFW